MICDESENLPKLSNQCPPYHLRITIWHPLNGETRPGQGVRIQCIIEEGSVLLPDLVLLKDALLLQLIGIVHYMKKLG